MSKQFKQLPTRQKQVLVLGIIFAVGVMIAYFGFNTYFGITVENDPIISHAFPSDPSGPNQYSFAHPLYVTHTDQPASVAVAWKETFDPAKTGSFTVHYLTSYEDPDSLNTPTPKTIWEYEVSGVLSLHDARYVEFDLTITVTMDATHVFTQGHTIIVTNGVKEPTLLTCRVNGADVLNQDIEVQGTIEIVITINPNNAVIEKLELILIDLSTGSKSSKGTFTWESTNTYLISFNTRTIENGLYDVEVKVSWTYPTRRSLSSGLFTSYLPLFIMEGGEREEDTIPGFTYELLLLFFFVMMLLRLRTRHIRHKKPKHTGDE